MPSHDYAITIGGVALNSIWPGLQGRFTKYTSGTRRGDNIVVPYRHGEYVVPDKYFAGSDVLLELFLPSDSPDAGAGALSEVALLLSSQSRVAVGQTDPHRGAIRAMVELITDPTETQNQFVYMFGLRNPSGFWEDASATSVGPANPPSITTSGDRPINDMVITFAGVGFFQHTDPLGQVSRVEMITGATGAPYVLDVGAGTIVNGSSTPMDRYFSHTQPWVMKFQPDAVQSLTSNVNITVSYRNKWA